jgi:hypothetical protein
LRLTLTGKCRHREHRTEEQRAKPSHHRLPGLTIESRPTATPTGIITMDQCRNGPLFITRPQRPRLAPGAGLARKGDSNMTGRGPASQIRRAGDATAERICPQRHLQS